MGTRWCLSLAMLVLLVAAANGQRSIVLKSGRIHTASHPGHSSLSSQWRRLHEIHSTAKSAHVELSHTTLAPFLVELRTPVRHDDMRTLNAWLQQVDQHSHVVNLIPDNAFLVLATEEAINAIKSLSIVLWVGVLEPSMKIDPSVEQFIAVERSLGARSLQIRLIGSPSDIQSAPFSHGVGDVLTQQVQSRAGLHAQLSVGANGKLIWKYDARDMTVAQVRAVLSVFSESLFVQWIEPWHEGVFLNRAATSLLQAGSPTSPDLLTPVWDAGLTGRGQVIGLADTGIDYGHCLLHDVNQRVQLNRTMTYHRKLASYRLTKDFPPGDAMLGHGTHVAASIVGSKTDKEEDNPLVRKYKGMAPDAKLAFAQLVDPREPTFIVPENITDILEQARVDSARVFCQTWGNKNSYTYDALAHDIDAYAYDHPGFLIVVAAGNDGEKGEGTVMSPATAKNVLAVGSVENMASLQMQYYNGLRETEMVDAIKDICVPSKFNDRKFCDLLDQDAPCDARACTITPRDICNIKELKEELFCPSDRLLARYARISVVSSFSSHGLTGDNRIKPDVLAVGDIVMSARSGGQLGALQCSEDFDNQYNTNRSIAGMSGTSHAAGFVAGMAALVRQYFTEGRYYWNNTRVQFDPPAALVKAVLVNSGQDVIYLLNSHRDTHPLPEGIEKFRFQGFGRVQLAATLALNNIAADSRPMLYVDSFSYLSDGNVTAVKYCMRAYQPIKVTLVWTDPPAPLQATTTLVNDLDLTLFSSDGQTLYGNRDHGHDDANTVEQVSAPAGSYAIIVSAARVLQTQKFAIVISGKNFTETKCEDVQGCPNNCNGMGSCVNNICEGCGTGARQPDCGSIDDGSALATPPPFMLIGAVAGGFFAITFVVAAVACYRYRARRPKRLSVTSGYQLVPN